jgi:hypothetical protein
MLSRQRAPMMRATFTFFWFLLSGALASLVRADSGLEEKDLREREIALFEANHPEQRSIGSRSPLVVATQDERSLATDELIRHFHELNLTFTHPSRKNYHHNKARAPFNFYPGTTYYSNATCYRDLITPGVYILHDVQYTMPNASVTVCLEYCYKNFSTPFNYAGVEGM